MHRMVLLTAFVFGCSNNALPTENNSSGGTSGGTTAGTTGSTTGSTTGGSTGTTGTTGGPPGSPCKTACDCMAGLACFQNMCVQSPMGMLYCCDSGTCPSGSYCQSSDGSIGRCGSSTTGTSGGCKTACDCPAGEACFMGNCFPPPQGQLYCCDNGSCPSGGYCQASDGSFMMCGGIGGFDLGVNSCTTVMCMTDQDCLMAGCTNGCRRTRGTCR
jgi:hypothetical protein